MKVTGIVRRIDELGRIVIPKEIRKTLRIKEGDPMEIHTEKDQVVFRKYSPVSEVSKVSEIVADNLHERVGCVCLITDTDKVIYTSKGKRKELIGKNISDQLYKIIKSRETTLLTAGENRPIALVKEGEKEENDLLVCPIHSDGYCYGAVVLCSKNRNIENGGETAGIVEFIASVIAKQF